MEYKLLQILNLHKKKSVSIEQAIDQYFTFYEIALMQLKTGLDVAVNKNETYIYPTNNTKLYANIKLLTIAGFLLCYEITNNDMFTLYGQQFVDGNKLFTPDVFFYVIVVLNEILNKLQESKWQARFTNVINDIDAIAQINPVSFSADLATLKDLQIKKQIVNLSTILENIDPEVKTKPKKESLKKLKNKFTISGEKIEELVKSTKKDLQASSTKFKSDKTAAKKK